MPSQRPTPSRRHPLNNDMLVRGVILAMVGLILIVGPHFMSASPTRDMFVHAQIPAWFALVLGLAFMGQYAARRYKEQKRQQP
ncbi:MAG: hypothetical protein KBT18_01390 [Comamonas sp.]|nr:hypothetical protein [Candidatus Comamonas equi]